MYLIYLVTVVNGITSTSIPLSCTHGCSKSLFLNLNIILCIFSRNAKHMHLIFLIILVNGITEKSFSLAARRAAPSFFLNLSATMHVLSKCKTHASNSPHHHSEFSVVQRSEFLAANPRAVVQSRQPAHSSPSCSSFLRVGR